jgi:hypothetical protein
VDDDDYQPGGQGRVGAFRKANPAQEVKLSRTAAAYLFSKYVTMTLAQAVTWLRRDECPSRARSEAE